MTNKFDYIKALVDSYAHGDGGWRLYLAICAITDYLGECYEAENLDEDGEAIIDILEQCLLNKEEDSAVTVIHFTASEGEDGEIQVNVKKDEAAAQHLKPLNEEEIKQFEEMLKGIPTAKKEEEDDSSNDE